MFLNAEARNLLLKGECQKFPKEEWPRTYATIQRLGLRAEELLRVGGKRQPSPTWREGELKITVIEARGLRKAYGTTIALDGVDLWLKKAASSDSTALTAPAKIKPNTGQYSLSFSLRHSPAHIRCLRRLDKRSC